MIETQLAELLAQAGLRFCGVDRTLGTLPVKAAWLSVSCRREDGRRDLVVPRDDAQLLAKANSAWSQLATESGLLGGEEREFLLGVDFAEPESSPILRWVRVQLMEDWDVMGAGVESGLLGSGAFCPEFVMMALDETVVLRGTTWEQRIGVLTVPHPHRVEMIRTYVERLAANPRTEPAERTIAENWLTHHPKGV
ncbi:hypothetical protein AB0J57_03365 [Streptomyces sp. NPDC049837]|uniref:hypothetical protein n=1 Tax=Streptomyces sp. NPDC049837 TaxID=3155277 RepID=UPI00343E55AA